MSDTQEGAKTYPYLTSYIRYLLDHQYQEALIEDNMKRARENGLPLLHYLSSLTEDELRQWWKASFIDNFLIFFIQGKPGEAGKGMLEWWEKNRYDPVDKEKIVFNDFFIAFRNRRSTLIHFLGHYSTSTEVWLQVMEDIEKYFNYYEKLSLESYNKTQQELLERNRTILEEHRNQLQMITNGIPALICYIDRDRIYRFINATYYEWFGPEAAKLPGMTLEEGLGSKGYEAIKGFVDKALAGESVYFETLIHCRLGPTYIEGRYIPDIAPDGTVRGYIAMIINISESVRNKEQIKTVNEELTRKNELLVKINNDLDNFIYTASHDLKAPISNIEGLVRQLSDFTPDSPGHGMTMKFINESVGRLKNTIANLTDIAKIQRGYEDDVTEVNSIPELLHEAEINLEGLLQEARPQIRKDLQVEQIMFPSKDLRSILLNLLSNAVKYRKPDEPCIIEISSRKEGNETIITFCDNGLGIPENKHDKVFQMFKRMHDHVEGTGLGLYIVKRIMENKGGRIELRSRKNEGATFTLYFPA